MRRIGKGLIAVGLVVGAVAAIGPAAASTADRHRWAHTTLRDVAGAKVGTVQMRTIPGNAVLVAIRVRGLTPGFHGLHVHTVGMCDHHFATAGGHFNPSNAGHGDHAGDMPSLLVRKDGTGSLAFETDRFRINDLFDKDGSAIMIHAGSDNYANIPPRYTSSTPASKAGPDAETLKAGDAGDRVACGVLVR